MSRVICLWTIAFFSIATLTHAEVARLINYQGLLTGADEQPVAEDVYKLTFTLYDEDGTNLWSEVHENVYIVNGLFHVLLGDLTQMDMPFDRPYFIGIRIGDDPELEPRMFLSTVPYSIRSDIANSVQGFMVSEEPQPNTLLPLDDNGTFPASVLPQSDSGGTWVRKDSPDTTMAAVDGDVLRIHNTGNGRGLTVLSNGSHGIYGKSLSDMAGVEGDNTGTGAGIRGSSQSYYGTIGYSAASDKAGVYGNSPDGAGVWGNSQNGYGVYGHSAENYGVYGHSTSTNEWTPSIYGRHEGSGDGVYGWSQSRHGVYGVTQSPDATDAGVYGTNHGNGPAVLADGNLMVKGKYTGNIGPEGGAPYPKAAFDSGWIVVDKGAQFTLGVQQYLPAPEYDRNNFIVDMQSVYWENQPSNFSCSSFDPDSYGYPKRGAWYTILSDNSIVITLGSEEEGIDKIRIRVWYVK